MNKKELDDVFPRDYWLNELEIPYLFRKAAEADGPIVEIGAAYGGSTTVLLLGKPRGVRVVSVDSFVGDSMGGFRATAVECRAAVRQAAGEALYRDWTLIARPSAEVAATWRSPIGLLYIDGDHSYEGVRQDFECWSPYLLPGASIIFHDSRRDPTADPHVFAQGWPGPTQLVRELVAGGTFEVVEWCFSMTELRRRA